MKVLVIGANGQIGKQVVEKLAASDHNAIAMVRKEEQVDKMKELGAAEVVLANLEEDFSDALNGAEAVIFAAGSGGHTGPEKTTTVDLWGSIKAVDYAIDKGIQRFVQLSSVGAGDPDAFDEKIKHYMVAKGVSDHHLQVTDLDYTIVRPGPLTNEDAIGKIKTADVFSNVWEESITRADVAQILVEVIDRKNTYGKTFEVVQGDKEIADALDAL